MTVNTTSGAHSLFTESFLFAGRHVRHWRRLPVIPIQSVLLPTLLLVVYYLLVGESMRAISGTDNLNGLVPVCALAGGMFGALGAGFNVPLERSSGLLSRWWSFPVHRASVLVGRNAFPAHYSRLEPLSNLSCQSCRRSRCAQPPPLPA